MATKALLQMLIFLFLERTTVISDSYDPKRRILVKIYQKNLKVPCELETDGLPLLHVAWYICATAEHCRTEWDRHRIAHIENMSDVSVDYPEKFDLSLNATLSITEVLPEDDRKVFICRGKVQYVGIKEHATLIEIATELPKIRTKSPRSTLVVKGMPLHLDCKVTGFPLPLVTWFRGNQLLLNQSNADTSLVRRNLTNADAGIYICKAENPVGNDNYTVEVNVIDMSSSPSSCPPDYQEVEGDIAYKVTTFLFFALLALAVGYIVYLKRNNRLENQENNTYTV